jgi:hypothetical protein
MNHDSRIIRYTILFYGKKKKVMKDINIFTHYIQINGVGSIRQIIFDFVCPPHFPYSCHNISLCNIGNNTFKFQFYHYYNSFNQLIILHPDAQYTDYCYILKIIQSNTSLTTLLEPHIIPLHFS